LRHCEAVAADYLDHFQSRGFKVAMPATRLTVIILTDDSSRSAFKVGLKVQGIPIDMTRDLVPPGHYEPPTNRAVLGLHARTRRLNDYLDLRLLAHEVTHQLTFNTGMLDRRGDVPRSISEGLAEYGAVLKTGQSIAPGYPRENLMTLVRSRKSGTRWYPFAQLLADDRPFLLNCFSQHKSLAYSQAWLLIHWLINDRSRGEGFRAYLEAIRPRRDQEHRLDDAEKHLGDLNRLDKDLLAYFVRLNMSA
jgi:hypothetical protein